MTKRPVQLISHRIEHHADHSGYDRIADFVGTPVRPLHIHRRLIPNRLMWKLARDVVSYDRTSLNTELGAARAMLSASGEVFHVLYGENSYRYLGLLNNRRGNDVVASFHIPPETFREHMGVDAPIQRLSAVICVGKSQVPFFEGIMGTDRVHYVPLGVDVDYFSLPDEAVERDNNTILSVGHHLRDFPTLRGALELMAVARPEIRLEVISLPYAHERLGRHPNLNIQSAVPETALRDAYRSSALFVMPLLNATANCALLEAMACGLPIVATDVGAISDYVDDECAVMVEPQNARALSDVVLDLLSDPDTLARMSAASRRRAEKFSWPLVCERLEEVYESLA